MRNFNKYVSIGIALLATLFVFALILGCDFLNSEEGTDLINSNMEPYSIKTADENTTESLFPSYWNRVLEIYNITTEDYEVLPDNDKQLVFNHTIALWGYENGTFTLEEAELMIEHNSPNIDYYIPNTGVGSWAPHASPGSIIQNDEWGFKTKFKVQAGHYLGERITRVRAFVDKDHTWTPTGGREGAKGSFYVYRGTYSKPSTAIQLNVDEYEDNYGFGRNSGLEWLAYDGIWGFGHVKFEASCVTGFADDWVKIVIVCDWQTLGLFGWINEQDYSLMVNYIWKPCWMGPCAVERIDVDDDDYSPPWIYGLHYGYRAETYIFDDDDYLYFTGYVRDHSDVGSLVGKVGLIGGTTFYGSKSYVSGTLPPAYRFRFYIPNPRNLGYHLALIKFYDNDNDRTDGSDDREVLNKWVGFWVRDEDTTGPDISIIYNGLNTDGDPGSWHVVATDSSGIGEIIIKVDGTVVNSFIGDYMGNYIIDIPVPKTLGEHTIEVYAKDADKDRGSIDQEDNSAENSVNIIDDDTSGPSIGIKYFGSNTDGDPGYWNIYVTDSISDLEEITIFVDGSLYLTITEPIDPYSINIPISNTFGEHTIQVYAINADTDRDLIDQESNLRKDSVYIIDDDDTTAPVIFLDYDGIGSDGNPGIIAFSFSDFESDASAIISIFGPNEYERIFNYFEEGSFSIILNDIGANELGEYIVRLDSTNNDNDGWSDDEDFIFMETTFSIHDDDMTAPIINIQYIGSDNDGDPGYWSVLVTDTENEVDSVEVYYISTIS